MLRTCESGSGKETLVLVHGYLETSNVWEKMLPELEKNFKVVRVDLPGHNHQAAIAEIQTMDLMAQELKKTVDHLGLKDFHLVGHSMGGYVSLAYAEAHPHDLKSLTLFFSTYFGDSSDKKENRQKSLRIIEEQFGKYVNAGVRILFNPHELELHAEEIELAKREALNTTIDGAIACVKGMMARPTRKSVLKKLNCKILIVTGRFDVAADYKQIIENLPDRDNIHAYMLNCGHQGHLERPAICTEILKRELNF